MNMHVYIYKKMKHCFFVLFICLFVLVVFLCVFFFGGEGAGWADEVTRYLKYHPVSKVL